MFTVTLTPLQKWVSQIFEEVTALKESFMSS